MYTLRTALPDDVPILSALIARSGLALSAPYYDAAQAKAITHHVFGVDTQLIADASYFLIEDAAGKVVACGGWSRRRTLFGGDQTKTGPDPLLDPQQEPARIRAYFVAPEAARQGLGRRLMDACVAAAKAHGFSALELVSTLPGEPLYAACGFQVLERYDLHLPGPVDVPVSRMGRGI
jgi:GNAT superfamily N-acetyltransferase